MQAAEFFQRLNEIVWGMPTVLLLVGTGIYLMLRLRFRPLLYLPFAIRQALGRPGKAEGRDAKANGDITPFQSLMTTLAATIGTGNIVGVATAISMGGLGSIFWMWVSGLFSLSCKYAESALSVHYRQKNSRGEYVGGPMYAMRDGFRNRLIGGGLAACFALFTILASFGSGNIAQANSMADALREYFGVPVLITGIVTAVLAGYVMLGGIKSIGRVSEKMVPVMALVYIGGALAVIFANIGNLGGALAGIFREAFSTRAAAGGVAGYALAMRYGVARGLFSNEAGLGSAGIAAAAAKTDHPARQGYVSMTGAFFITMIVCSITALAIACSGVDYAAMGNAGVGLTIAAFASVLGKAGGFIVTVSLILFAFSSIIGWSYYGEKSLEFLCGGDYLRLPYRLLFAVVTLYGAITPVGAAWSLADAANGLMAIPNLLCLLALGGTVVKLTDDFHGRKQAHPKVKMKLKSS